MRLWTLHPKYLDTKGLVALWREALGAQRNILGLMGKMPLAKGYNSHPQLKRFTATKNPVNNIGAYLQIIWKHAVEDRELNFNQDLIHTRPGYNFEYISVSSGQVMYEAQLLSNKIEERNSWNSCYTTINEDVRLHSLHIEVHPLFIIENDYLPEPWERLKTVTPGSGQVKRTNVIRKQKHKALMQESFQNPPKNRKI